MATNCRRPFTGGGGTLGPTAVPAADHWDEMKGRILTAGCLVALAALAACSGDASSASSNFNSSSATATSTPEVTPTPDADSPSAEPANPEVTAAAQGCLQDPMLHVYNPDRLRVLNPCVTVSGTVELIRSEADGDYHVRVQLDAGQLCGGQNCLDAANLSQQGGDLVVEPVCEHSITQTDAVAACSGYHNTLAVPPVGTHTTVTGPWVLDQDHGWNEIHPAEMFGGSSMPAGGSAPPAAPAPSQAKLSVTITESRYGYVAAKTSPGAVCSAQAKLPSGRISTAAGLQVQDTAGSDGVVSWTYRTSTSTNPGTGTHTVSCTLNGASASASAPFTVS